MTHEFSRKLAIERIGPAGYDLTVEANVGELVGLATRLRLPAVNALTCRFRLRPTQNDMFVAEGWLDAVVTQTCVVSLDDFQALVSDHFIVRLVPAGSESDDIDPESTDEIAYRDGAIDMGEAAAEQLALALDPWPRKPDASLPAAEMDEPTSPFATLRQKPLRA
jgi:hypothetical protein